mmetsp:Transcript_13410/g.37656  ORF Transcript_13410/g.37656 Transcript_13410/m.37656 type:complete len:123 (+) Transcript_13410:1162-1530(+)
MGRVFVSLVHLNLDPHKRARAKECANQTKPNQGQVKARSGLSLRAVPSRSCKGTKHETRKRERGGGGEGESQVGRQADALVVRVSLRLYRARARKVFVLGSVASTTRLSPSWEAEEAKAHQV